MPRLAAALRPLRAADLLGVRQAAQKDYAADPTGFMRDVLGETQPARYGLYDKQIEMAEAVRDCRRVAVAGANGTGKDWLAGRLILWWLKSHSPAKCIVIGPTSRQVSEIVWRETRLAYNGAKTPLGGRMLPQAPHWDLTDDSFALGFATNDPYNLQGFHSPHLMVVITEAHGVGQQHIEAAKRLNPERLLLTGNPLSLAGEFYDAFHGNADVYRTISISAFDTPNVQMGKLLVPGMVTTEDVEERRREWGEGNPLYVSGVLGQFPSSLEDTMIALAWVDTARKYQAPPFDTPEAETAWKAANPIIISCDVARFGSDRTVVVRRQGPLARIIWRVQGQDTMQIAGWLKGYRADHGEVSHVVVDDTGVGGGVTDRLREQGVSVVAFNAGASASDKDAYANAIAEAWGLMARAFERGEVGIDNDTALISQLVTRRKRLQSDRRIILESKADLKAKGGKSPDECLVAGTLVRTLRGDIPIEYIQKGDFVLTRNGYHPVLISRLTNAQANVMTVSFSSGQQLTGTPNHCLWVKGKGFVPIDTLAINDIIETCSEGSVIPLSGQASYLLGGQNRPGNTYGITSGPMTSKQGSGSRVWGHSIGKYIGTLMGKFLWAATYITKTSTRLITIWPIWNAFHPWSTEGSMLMIPSGNLAGAIWIKRDRQPPSGISQKRGDNGIGNMPNKHGLNGNPNRGNVCNAGRYTCPGGTGEQRNSVPLAVVTTGITRQKSILVNWSARAVEGYSLAINNGDNDIVPVRVLAITGIGKAPVYNLRVHGHSEFYANGILTHNSDALAMTFSPLVTRRPRLWT